MEQEEKLLQEGWKKEMLCIHISEYDTNSPTNNHRRLSYDLTNDFTGEQIGVLRAWCNKVNEHFPNLKMFITGSGWVKTED